MYNYKEVAVGFTDQWLVLNIGFLKQDLKTHRESILG